MGSNPWFVSQSLIYNTDLVLTNFGLSYDCFVLSYSGTFKKFHDILAQNSQEM